MDSKTRLSMAGALLRKHSASASTATPAGPTNANTTGPGGVPPMGNPGFGAGIATALGPLSRMGTRQPAAAATPSTLNIGQRVPAMR